MVEFVVYIWELVVLHEEGGYILFGAKGGGEGSEVMVLLE